MTSRANHISRQQMLESVPCLNPEVVWKELDSGVLMAVYRRHLGGARRLLSRLLPMAETAEVVLDEAGSRVVRHIDGHRTVRDLIGFVGGEFRLSRKESEASVLKYMEMLGQRRLIGFALQPPTGGKG